MKCQQGCGWIVQPGSRCMNPNHLLRNRARAKPRSSAKTAGRRHLENSRCPMCRGDDWEGKRHNGGKPCFLSICGCTCHANLRGMGRGTYGFTPADLHARLYRDKQPLPLAPRRML